MLPDSGKPVPPANVNWPYCAVLCAGGRSRRMGQEKAALSFAGEPLWARQLATLRAIGASEVLIAGRADGPYAGAAKVIDDLTPGAGPLAVLEAAFAVSTAPFLVVLGIDMPVMNPAFLRKLIARAEQVGRSVIPQGAAFFEPLAAVYGRALEPLVKQCLRETDRSMQHLVREALRQDLAVAYPLGADERALFRNLNSPEDLR